MSGAPNVPDTDGWVDLAEDAAERVRPKRASGGGRGGSGPRRRWGRHGKPKGEGGSLNGLSQRLTSRIFSPPGGGGEGTPSVPPQGPGPEGGVELLVAGGKGPPVPTEVQLLQRRGHGGGRWGERG